MKLYTKQMATLAAYRKNKPVAIDAVLIETDERLPPAEQLGIENTLDEGASPEVPHHLQRNEAHKLEVAVEIEHDDVRSAHLPECAFTDVRNDT